MNVDVISQDLRTVLRRLKLSRILDTLPERLGLVLIDPAAERLEEKSHRSKAATRTRPATAAATRVSG